MSFKVVLYQPQIPQNTGNIARLTAATSSELHLIKPLGFEINDRYLKRAGLDYWPYVSLFQHENWDAFSEGSTACSGRVWLVTTKASKAYFEASFSPDDCLVFGSETAGLPESLHHRYWDSRLTIPMACTAVRSLNLSSSVAVVLYEAIRQQSTRLE